MRLWLLLFLLSCGKPITDSQTNVSDSPPPEILSLSVHTQKRKDRESVRKSAYYYIPYIFDGNGNDSWAQVTFPDGLRLCLFSNNIKWYSHHFRKRGKCEDQNNWEYRDSVKLDKGSPIVLELIDGYEGYLNFHIMEE